MQHANIWTPSARVFSPAVWVSLRIHHTSVTERCQLGERHGSRFYRVFCSLSRSSNLLLYAAITNRSRISDPEKNTGQLPCFTESERCLIRRVMQFIFNIWMKVLFSNLNGSCCRCEVWSYVFLPVDMMWTHNRNNLSFLFISKTQVFFQKVLSWWCYFWTFKTSSFLMFQ